MEPRVHRRWLDYIEMYDYFHEPGQKRLDRDRFIAFDAELDSLVERERTVGLTAEEHGRLVALRRVLLRD